MCLSRAQQTKSKQRTYGIGNRTLQCLFFKPFAQLHLSRLRLQLVLLEFGRLTESAVSFLSFTSGHISPWKASKQVCSPRQICLCVCLSSAGWEREAGVCFWSTLVCWSRLVKTGACTIRGSALYSLWNRSPQHLHLTSWREETVFAFKRKLAASAPARAISSHSWHSTKYTHITHFI